MDATEHPIRRLRKQRGLTAEQLAARAEVASATVYRAERGISEPSRATRRALAEVLGVDPRELIHDHEPEADTASTGCGTNNPHHSAEADGEVASAVAGAANGG